MSESGKNNPSSKDKEKEVKLSTKPEPKKPGSFKVGKAKDDSKKSKQKQEQEKEGKEKEGEKELSNKESKEDKVEKKEKPSEEKKQSTYALKKGKAKEFKHILRGQAHIQSTYNNTIVNITDLNGNNLCWGSAGLIGFKGAKKSTPYAATLVVRKMEDKIKKYGVQEVDVYLKGIGAGRESAVRALNSIGLRIMSIKDVTPMPHNGCRPKKARRV